MVSLRMFALLLFSAAILLQPSSSHSVSESSQLVSAYRRGDVDLCRALIRGGALDDFPGPKNREKIYNKLRILESLLSSGIAVMNTRENDVEKAPSKEGEFDVALIPGSSLVTRMAVNVTAVKNWGNKTIKDGKKPIHLITLLPDVSPNIVKIILENGNDDVNTKADSGVTPLMLAALSGNMEVIKYLVQRGARINDVASFLFEDERLSGHFAFAKLFSKKELSSFVPRFYYSALLSAIMGNDLDLISYLLSKGADVNIKGQGWVALFYSVHAERKEILEILLRSGSDVNCKDMFGSTALHKVAETGNVEIARILLKHGARLNATDALGWMPIHVASFYFKIGGTKMIRFLVDSGSSIDSLTEGGYSPLILVEAGNDQLFLYYLAENIDFLNQTKNYTNLRDRSTSTDIVDSVIQLGASINHQDDILGWSTLHWAAASGDLDSAKLLVKYGAVVSIKSKTGLNPYDIAKYFGRKTVAEFLRTAKDLVSL